MKNIKLIINIILPSIICVIGLNLIFGKLYYYPLLFGAVLGLFNWSLHKKKLIIGVILSVIVSYITFFLTYFGWGGINNFISFVFEHMGYHFYGKESIALKTFVLFFFVIAPLLVFYSYRFVFNFSKTKLTKLITVLSIIILFSYSLLNLYFDSQLSQSNSSNLYLWQFVMVLAIQLILYQKEWKKFFVRNKKQ